MRYSLGLGPTLLSPNHLMDVLWRRDNGSLCPGVCCVATGWEKINGSHCAYGVCTQQAVITQYTATKQGKQGPSLAEAVEAVLLLFKQQGFRPLPSARA